MSLMLPPPSRITADSLSTREVYEKLTALMAGQPGARSTYLFYEELDAWLGPWGPSGYPVGYGKYYTQAFFNNAALMNNPVTRQWVERTAVLLQEALRDYIVQCIRSGALANLKERQLRRAAFNSHARAYVKGGLARVALKAPWLLLVILAIPAREFLPGSPNFQEAYGQVFTTLGLLMPALVRRNFEGA